ncbi:hypothetical protein FRC07_014482, partial [Ceratobasidium sp. 392]
MLTAKLLTVLALLATSASSLSIGPSSNHVAHRRHASRGVHVVRGSDGVHAVRRDSLPARKRGINARRCVPRSSSTAPTSTSVSETLLPDPEPTTSSAADPPSEPTTTSVEPTKTKAQTTSTPKPATKTTASEQETPTSGSGGGGSSGETFTGQATFYATGLGACGIINKDTDYIAAASQHLFDGFGGYTGGDPNGNPICNKKVTAHYQGKT